MGPSFTGTVPAEAGAASSRSAAAADTSRMPHRFHDCMCAASFIL